LSIVCEPVEAAAPGWTAVLDHAERLCAISSLLASVCICRSSLQPKWARVCREE
jgi:hypothetical protein